ncbi:MAG: DUF4432 family protein [Verrucomicrobia bacterium]|nr:DUF4432 family protein [Verrucomicrobiota bacterium]
MNRLKRVPAALSEHAGSGERGLIVTAEPEADGDCHVGLINDQLKLGLEFIYSAKAFPRMAHWQHYGPRGSFASALEPFYGSLLGRARDQHPLVDATLAPDESRHYRLRLRVLRNPAELRELAAHDGPIQPVR